MKTWVPRIAGWLLAATVAVSVIACSASDSKPPNPVRGLVVSVQEDTLKLDADSGGEFSFEIDDPNVTTDHLKVHQTERLPVLISWEERGSRLVAIIIADA